MARKGSSEGVGILALVGSPYIVGRIWPTVGWLLVAAAVAGAGLLVRALRQRSAAEPERRRPSPLWFIAAVWVGSLSMCGARHGQESEERRLVEEKQEALDRARRAHDEQVERELEKQRRAAESRAAAKRAAEHEQLIKAELAKPTALRAADAIAALNGAEDDASREQLLCYLRSVIEDARSKGDALQRQAVQTEKRVAGRLLAAKRREANELRSVICADGSYSPTCSCSDIRQGCCSHHGGVSHCEKAEEVSVDCPIHSARDHVAAFLATTARDP